MPAPPVTAWEWSCALDHPDSRAPPFCPVPTHWMAPSSQGSTAHQADLPGRSSPRFSTVASELIHLPETFQLLPAASEPLAIDRHNCFHFVLSQSIGGKVQGEQLEEGVWGRRRTAGQSSFHLQVPLGDYATAPSPHSSPRTRLPSSQARGLVLCTARVWAENPREHCSFALAPAPATPSTAAQQPRLAVKDSSSLEQDQASEHLILNKKQRPEWSRGLPKPGSVVRTSGSPGLAQCPWWRNVAGLPERPGPCTVATYFQLGNGACRQHL